MMESSGASSRLARSGWLWKRGQRRKTWKKRWHVIDPKEKCIRYFDTKANASDPSTALGTVSLIGAFVLNYSACKGQLKDEADKFGVGTCFAIQSNDRVLYVADDDDSSRSEWIRMLNYICRISGGKAAARDESVSTSTGGDSNAELVARRATEPWSPGEPYSHMKEFKEARRAGTRAYDNEISRLKNRVAKLIGTVPSSFLSQEKFERSVVAWQDGTHCFNCRSEFGTISKRKSNCRTCGRVTCTSPSCSDVCELEQIAKFLGLDTQRTTVSTRICCMCINDIERTKTQRHIAPGTDKFLKLYSKIQENKETADELIDSFNQITSSRSGLTPDEKLRVKEIKAGIDKAFQTVQAAANMMTQQEEARSGMWSTIAINIKDGCNAWQQPRSAAVQNRLMGNA